ncbi:DUF4435 domain-containing protein [Shewanella algae]|uniref:DUF4435 domain-containing protein n=1 Tax=Shewanella algae TaxID=38313 RepID=UPI003B675FAA
MPNFPAYTAEENLLRILMDKNTKYLLVEGQFDMSIFSELVSIISDKNKDLKEPVTVYGGGKHNILEWNKKHNPKNSSIILDMDFDNPDVELKSENITPLRKYSIENYFFDEDVIRPLMANLLSRSLSDIGDILSLEELRAHWATELSELMHVLFYYQKLYSGNKDKWNSYFINEGNGNWRISTERVKKLKREMLIETNKTYDECYKEFKKLYKEPCHPCIHFPGKLLFESFNRYLKSVCNAERDGAYSVITSPKSLVSNLTGRLIRNKELENIIAQAIA